MQERCFHYEFKVQLIVLEIPVAYICYRVVRVMFFVDFKFKNILLDVFDLPFKIKLK